MNWTLTTGLYAAGETSLTGRWCLVAGTLWALRLITSKHT